MVIVIMVQLVQFVNGTLTAPRAYGDLSGGENKEHYAGGAAVAWSDRPDCRIGVLHEHTSAYLDPVSNLTTCDTNSTCSSSFESVSTQPPERPAAWRFKCSGVCPTATYLMINLVWMSAGIAGIALGNLVNKRYFSILLVSVFGLMVAVIYRFFYDLEHMDTTPNPPSSIYPPTPTSHRSLPPCYSSVVRSETPPPTYNEYLGMVRAHQLTQLSGKAAILPPPTISSVIGNSSKSSVELHV
ncbi:hypothetical protein BIW11_05315 [Tropilaelaps mercedesae]|uniref:Uncharacterized protein n=1 Tax=Tropilaelaps mercedesae TaxID=418985 RepID=A0A1V9Y2U3_9ACAR|nr:hypothetical protein BIW11_05315 [Tropilaelaps mercedesae]